MGAIGRGRGRTDVRWYATVRRSDGVSMLWVAVWVSMMPDWEMATIEVPGGGSGRSS